ncbi:MAG: hypothetical protein Q8R04_02725 [Nanoarchaeota archaeon]|nr:hypothetical protein [Nanoarchaeota archaeon]
MKKKKENKSKKIVKKNMNSKERGKLEYFYKKYPKSSLVFLFFLLYQIIKVFLDTSLFRYIGLGVYFVILSLIINGSAKPALEYHFSTFEKSKKDQVALVMFILLYSIKQIVSGTFSILIWAAIIIIFFKYLWKYVFILLDIFAAATSEKK